MYLCYNIRTWWTVLFHLCNNKHWRWTALFTWCFTCATTNTGDGLLFLHDVSLVQQQTLEMDCSFYMMFHLCNNKHWRWTALFTWCFTCANMMFATTNTGDGLLFLHDVSLVQQQTLELVGNCMAYSLLIPILIRLHFKAICTSTTSPHIAPHRPGSILSISPQDLGGQYRVCTVLSSRKLYVYVT